MYEQEETPLCPHCGEEHLLEADIFGTNDEADIVCAVCDTLYRVVRVPLYTYSSYTLQEGGE